MRKITFLLSLVLLAACAKDAVEKPEHLLTEDEMVNIIYDITMIQAMRSTVPQALNDNNVNAKEYIYKKYKLDSLSFAQNNAYYAADMEHYEAIQKRVKQRIEKEKEYFSPKTDTSKPKDPKIISSPSQFKRDSLRRAASGKQ